MTDDATICATSEADGDGQAGDTSRSGSCLCGAVRYMVYGPMREVIYCHCQQCQKWSGNYVAATAAHPDQVKIIGSDSALRWYRSSDDAGRGFCQYCGSSLFWKPDRHAHLSIMAGGLNEKDGLVAGPHIFVGSRAPYMVFAEDERTYDGDLQAVDGDLRAVVCG